MRKEWRLMGLEGLYRQREAGEKELQRADRMSQGWRKRHRGREVRRNQKANQ